MLGATEGNRETTVNCRFNRIGTSLPGKLLRGAVHMMRVYTRCVAIAGAY